MAYFYDTLSGISGLTQYERFLENDVYIRNLKENSTDPLNYQLLEIRRAIGINTSTSINNAKFLSQESKKHFEDLTNKVCGTIEKGFGQVMGELEDINWRLNDINQGIGSLHSMLDWKTDLMIEEQRITNLYLGKVTGLLKIPESQKQRSYHVEQGITYLINAIEEGAKSDFYLDAFDEFSKAKEIEEKDYFCLNKIGLIHLHSLKHLDVKKADEYFKLSARYAKAIANATSSGGKSNQKRYNEKLDSSLTKENLLEEAASSLNYSSRCNYIQTNFEVAIELAKQAMDLHPTNPEYGMQLSKCLSANNQEREAADVLEKVINMDKYYSIKALTDQDFIGKSLILDKIEKIANDLIIKVSKEIEELNPLLLTNQKTSEISKSNQEFQKIENIFKEPTYLNARSVFDVLSKIDDREYIHYSQDAQHHRPQEEKKIQKLNLSQIIRIEHAEYKNNKRFSENFGIAEARRRKEYEAEIQAKKNKQVILTIVVIVAFLGVWIWSSSLDGWFNRISLKIVDIGVAIYAIAKIFDFDFD